jgi:lipopolysaccharide biosynthesis glycosyltransferase
MHRSKGPYTVICYVTDANFAIPSLISATTARKWVSSDIADIYILTIGLSDLQVTELTALAEPQEIRIGVMHPERLEGFDSRNVNRTHVPLSTLGRLFLHEFIPDKYDTLLYMDGDTWISGDITPLVTLRPPKLSICAAEDPSYFYRRDAGATGRRVRAYFSGLGLDGDRGYFNAGVLLSSLSTWRDVAGDAFRFFCQNVDRCLFHDQSALNAVAQGRRLKLSNKWDFMTDFRYWNVEASIEPKIYHFTGFLKPWMGDFFPWSDMSAKYVAALKALGPTSFAFKAPDMLLLTQVEAANKRISRRLATIFRYRRFARACELLKGTETHAMV